jgi:hypothetical protein
MLFMSFMVAKHSSRSLRRCVEMGQLLKLETEFRACVPDGLHECRWQPSTGCAADGRKLAERKRDDVIEEFLGREISNVERAGL